MKTTGLDRLVSPREGLWFAPPRPVRWTFRKLPAWTSCVLLPYFVVCWADDRFRWGLGRWPGDVFATVTLIFVAVGLGRFARDLLERWQDAHDRAFSDRPEGIEEFAVEAVFAADWRYLGIDRGVVWFEDGLLRFHGEATSFVLASEDVDVPWTVRAANSNQGAIPVGTLILVDAPAPAYVVVNPLGDGRKAFRERLKLFERDRRSRRRAAVAPAGALRSRGSLDDLRSVLRGTTMTETLPEANAAPRPGVWRAEPLPAPTTLSDAWYLPLSTLLLLLALIGGSYDLLAAGFLALVSFLVVLFVREMVWRRRRRADWRIERGLTGPDEFPSLVVFGSRGRRRGADRGIVWFADGAMGFSGERTSFLLAAEDFLPNDRNVDPMRYRMPLDALRLSADDGRAFVAVRSLGAGFRDAAFFARYREFIRETQPYAGSREWPPLSAYEAPALEGRDATRRVPAPSPPLPGRPG